MEGILFLQNSLYPNKEVKNRSNLIFSLILADDNSECNSSTARIIWNHRPCFPILIVFTKWCNDVLTTIFSAGCNFQHSILYLLLPCMLQTCSSILSRERRVLKGMLVLMSDLTRKKDLPVDTKDRERLWRCRHYIRKAALTQGM